MLLLKTRPSRSRLLGYQYGRACSRERISKPQTLICQGFERLYQQYLIPKYHFLTARWRTTVRFFYILVHQITPKVDFLHVRRSPGLRQHISNMQMPLTITCTRFEHQCAQYLTCKYELSTVQWCGEPGLRNSEEKNSYKLRIHAKKPVFFLSSAGFSVSRKRSSLRRSYVRGLTVSASSI